MFANYSRQSEKHANLNVDHQSSLCICALIIYKPYFIDLIYDHLNLIYPSLCALLAILSVAYGIFLDVHLNRHD